MGAIGNRYDSRIRLAELLKRRREARAMSFSSVANCFNVPGRQKKPFPAISGKASDNGQQ